MILIHSDAPFECDAFGILFTMTDGDRPVLCMVLREALDSIEPEDVVSDDQRVDRFNRNRSTFEMIANDQYAGGMTEPTVSAAMLTLRRA